MTDFELESKLKSVHVPERSEDYWENFPLEARRNLPRAEFAPRKTFLPHFAAGFAFAVLIFSFVLLPSFRIFLHDEQIVRRDLTQLPQHLQVLMADEHGLHYLIADQK